MDKIHASGNGNKEKSPSLAAFLSIFPGIGSIYNGNFFKGVTYMLLFAVLIVLTSNAHATDGFVFGLMIAGFYIFQIIDSYNEAGKINQNIHGVANPVVNKEDFSLFSAIAVLLVGLIFQLANFDILTYRQVTRLWPLALIAFGVKIVFNYFKHEDYTNDKH